MTQDEIDTMWQKAMHQSIKEGEMFTRYQFAKLVADKATEEANARANASWTLMCKKMVAIEREALAQLEQEPVVFYRCNGCGHEYQQMHPTSCDCMKGSSFEQVNYYTTPPQRTWVGLTDEEKDKLDAEYGDDTLAHLDAIEAKLKQKNGYAEEKNT